MIQLFVVGGPFMWLLLLFWLAGLAVAIDRIVTLSRESRPDGVDAADAGRARTAADLVDARVRQRLVWVLTLARILAVTGVLGSLFGAVSATDAIAKAGDVNVRILVAGIAEMLIPAIAGLLAGITLYVAHALLVSAADKRSVRANEQLISTTG